MKKDKILTTTINAYNQNFMEYVKKIVCNYYEKKIKGFDSVSRKSGLPKLRQVAAYLMNKKGDVPNYQIAKYLNKNNATVIYYIDNIERYLTWDDDLKMEIEDLEQIVKVESKLSKLALSDLDCYTLDLNVFSSAKEKNSDKAIVFKGYSENEIKAILAQIDFSTEKIRTHISTGIFIIEKN